MRSKRPNLFRHAARELHQDAVLAWLLEWCSPWHSELDNDLHQAATEAITTLLGRHPRLDGAHVVDVSGVQTQWRGADVKAELALDAERSAVLIIENKTTSTRHSDQLRRYQQLAEAAYPSHLFLGLYVKTGWLLPGDRDLPPGWVLVSREDLLTAVNGTACPSGIFEEYVRHLEEVDEAYRDQRAALDDPNLVNWALAHHHVQWHLIERLFAEFSGSQYNGVNLGGSGWTQFSFGVYPPEAPQKDALFWRLDKRKPARNKAPLPYLALRAYSQYDKKDQALRQGKLQRLLVYQQHFQRVVENLRTSGMPLVPGRPVTDRSGNYESEVGVFFVQGPNSVEALLHWIPRVHRQFVGALGLPLHDPLST